MRIVVSGDWHLDRLTAGFDRFSDICRGVDTTIRVAIEKKADLYIFLGDLANPNNVRSHRAVAKAMFAANMLSKEGIESIWIVGNHDVIEDGSGSSVLSTLASAGHFVMSRPGAWIGDDGKWICVFPYPSAVAAYDPEIEIEKIAFGSAAPSLVVGHLSLAGTASGSESVEMARGRGYEWPVAAIKARWPEVPIIGGHYHRRQESGGIIFAGSLERLAFDEEDNSPGYLIAEV